MARQRWAIVGGALLITLGAVQPCAAKPCSPIKPPAQMVREVSHVFEGVLVDQWNEIVADQSWRGAHPTRTLRTLRWYRFQILRNWSGTYREVTLTHGWYEGSPYWQGAYPRYQVGERYLVFAVLHDSPAHSFTSSCLPGAKGADVDRLAAELPLPMATYEASAPPSQPFWTAPVRRAREYQEALLALIMIAVD